MSTGVRADAFRAACAQFPTGVTVVTASTAAGDFGVTVNAFTSLSLEPPQVVVCLARTSNTWTAIRRARAFAVNVLAADQLALARLFATKEPDKFGDGFGRLEATFRRGVAGAPLLDGTLAALECLLEAAIPRDTHMVLIGEAVGVRHDQAKDPALFFRGRLRDGFEATPTGGATPGTA